MTILKKTLKDKYNLISTSAPLYMALYTPHRFCVYICYPLIFFIKANKMKFYNTFLNRLVFLMIQKKVFLIKQANGRKKQN
jgi:hypothetical protein